MALVITEHFEKRWRQEFNEAAPLATRLVAMLQHRAVWIQSSRLLYEPDGTQYVMLAHYLLQHRGQTVLVKIDWLTEKAVTIVSFKSKERKQGRTRPRPGAMPGQGGGRIDLAQRRRDAEDRGRAHVGD